MGDCRPYFQHSNPPSGRHSRRKTTAQTKPLTRSTMLSSASLESDKPCGEVTTVREHRKDFILPAGRATLFPYSIAAPPLVVTSHSPSRSPPSFQFVSRYAHATSRLTYCLEQQHFTAVLRTFTVLSKFRRDVCNRGVSASILATCGEEAAGGPWGYPRLCERRREGLSI